MKLYGFWRSSATWRVRIALHLKQLPFDYVPISLLRKEQHAEAFRQLNPMKHVPVLSIDHEGTTHHIAESMAIVELLDELYPSPPLLPRHPIARARARQLASTVTSGIQPLLNSRVQARVRDQLGADPNAWSAYWLQLGLEALETMLKGTAGKFAVGDDLTVADVCLVPQLYAARRFGVTLEPYPTIRAIDERCAALPAFQKAAPENQPDYDGGRA